MIEDLIVLLVCAMLAVVYLAVGTLYARSQSVACYRSAAARWNNERYRNNCYNWLLASRVLGWPVIWPTLAIGKIAKGPVQVHHTAIADAKQEMSVWKSAISDGATPTDRDTATQLYFLASEKHEQAKRVLKELES